jgi:hypothetical protein
VNWDATIDSKSKRIGMGILARGHDEMIVAAMCSSKPFHLDPASAKAYVAWRLASFYTDLSACKLVVEGDSLELVQALRKDTTCWGRYGHLVEDATRLINLLSKRKVHHVKRIWNEIAHRLAKFTLNGRDEEHWRFEYPPCIQEAVIADFSNI